MSIALAVMIAFLPAARALTMGTATAATSVSFGGNCSGGVQYTPVDNVDYRLNANPDTVTFPYSISWADSRSLHSSPTATHYFFLQTVHSGNTQSTSRTEYTTGGESGSDTLSLGVSVSNGDYVDVTFTANLSAGAPGLSGCPITSSVTLHYHFVYS